jgi:hypothetical protein
MRTKLRAVAVIAVLFVTVTACAAGPNTAIRAGGPGVAGFWLGLWHGLISPITFIVSLFNDQVNLYEVHNDGNWYNFGFMIGISAVFSALARPGAAAGRRVTTRNRQQTPGG